MNIFPWTDVEGLTLLIPDKPDPERSAVASAWENHGGQVMRLGRFWEPPSLAPASVRLYGPDTFCLVLQQKLQLDLVSPPDELLASVPTMFLRRDVQRCQVAELPQLTFPVFVKSVVPKQIHSAVYHSPEQLLRECEGLDDDAAMLTSQVVEFTSEFRAFCIGDHVLDCALYQGEGDPNDAIRFVSELVTSIDLPESVVVDVGRLDRGYALIEFNSSWGAGLNGCNAEKVLPAIERATRASGSAA